MDRQVKVVDMMFAMVLPIFLTGYPLAALEAKFSKARMILMV
jgi:hypothetical protein